jgi:undecaprenyl diphosphate synthase
MDGNGRWAELHGLPRTAGHEGGIEPVRATVRLAAELGIHTLTLFAFSSENFGRPLTEVESLMALFVAALRRELDELDSNGVRIRFIGNRASLGAPLAQAMQAAEQRTAANDRLNLVVAVAYGGRWDIAQAARQLARQAAAGQIDPDSIDEATVAAALTTAALPSIDLLIRTGGEQRISNFMLWDLAYSELFFSELLWPEFNQAEFERALDYFASRQRRFGRTAQQVGIGSL